MSIEHRAAPAVAQNGEVRQARRPDGPARHRAHNQELHELAEIRRHGGFQREMFA